MSLDDFEVETVYVWPENELPLEVFDALSTQWRIGFNGATGLDYSAIPLVMEELRVPKKKRKQVFSDIRIMESAALLEMRKDS